MLRTEVQNRPRGARQLRACHALPCTFSNHTKICHLYCKLSIWFYLVSKEMCPVLVWLHVIDTTNFRENNTITNITPLSWFQMVLQSSAWSLWSHTVFIIPLVSENGISLINKTTKILQRWHLMYLGSDKITCFIFHEIYHPMSNSVVGCFCIYFNAGIILMVLYFI